MKFIQYRTPTGKEYKFSVTEGEAEEIAEAFLERRIIVASGSDKVHIGTRENGGAWYESVPATWLINPDNIVELTIRDSEDTIRKNLAGTP